MRLFDFVVESYKYYLGRADGLFWISFIGFMGILIEFLVFVGLYISWSVPDNSLIRFMSLCFMIILLPPIAYYFKTKKESK